MPLQGERFASHAHPCKMESEIPKLVGKGVYREEANIRRIQPTAVCLMPLPAANF